MTTNVITLLDVPSQTLIDQSLMLFTLHDVDDPDVITLRNTVTLNPALTTLIVMALSSLYPDTWPTEPQVSIGATWWQDGMLKSGSFSLGDAVFPSEGDVDLGVLYGPTGIEFTGTLEQPSEADVLLGVIYGAAGTEFTGTLVGGGGGTLSYAFIG